jgi:uncharacterized YigZ family protein
MKQVEEQGYKMPEGHGAAEYIEKRSRFIGQVWPVCSEEEARGLISEAKSRYHDARHNCWCYILRESGILRYSDDGEPQGTAGQPMLAVFERQEIQNVCCVVTRYFGGVLLGAGGLVRAYTNAAKLALEDARVAHMRAQRMLKVSCQYKFIEKIKSVVSAHGGTIVNVQYGEEVEAEISAPEESAGALIGALTEITAGGALIEKGETLFTG